MLGHIIAYNRSRGGYNIVQWSVSRPMCVSSRAAGPTDQELGSMFVRVWCIYMCVGGVCGWCIMCGVCMGVVCALWFGTPNWYTLCFTPMSSMNI